MNDHDVPVHTNLPRRHYRPLYELAQKNGTTVAALVRELVRRGLESPPPATRPSSRRPRFVLTPEHDEQIRHLHAQGLNDSQVGRALGVSRSAAATHRKQLGLLGKPAGRPPSAPTSTTTDHQEVPA